MNWETNKQTDKYISLFLSIIVYNIILSIIGYNSNSNSKSAFFRTVDNW